MRVYMGKNDKNAKMKNVSNSYPKQNCPSDPLEFRPYMF
jgi:hypothetical protein